MALSAKTKKRILRLAQRFDKIKPEHFDISTWYSISPLRTYDEGFAGFKKLANKGTSSKLEWGTSRRRPRRVLLDEGFCGSIACVLGHAGSIKEFNKAGLYIDVTNIEEDKNSRYGSCSGSVIFVDPKSPKVGRPKEGFAAGEKFFDLTVEQSDAIFGGEASIYLYGSHNPKPKKVAAVLRKFVETDGASVEAAIKKMEKAAA